MPKFKVIDIKTGHEVSAEKIEKIAKEQGLMIADIDQFFIGEDGQLILTDDCGNVAYCDMEKLGLMPVFEGKYPDLEYFEAIMLGNMKRQFPEAFKNSFWMPQAELVDMFPQTWPNTACGFSAPNTLAGQAFTTKITTVMKVSVYDTQETYYGVFFGNRPAYLIDHANKTFLEDLKNRDLKTQYEVKKAY